MAEQLGDKDFAFVPAVFEYMRETGMDLECPDCRAIAIETVKDLTREEESNG